MSGSPRCAKLGIDLACCSGHELGGFPAGGLQPRVNRRALPVRPSRVKPRPRSSGDVCGRAFYVGFRQVAHSGGTDELGSLTYLDCELPDNSLGRDAEGSHLR